MPGRGPRYSEQEARTAIAAARSWAEALRNLGMCHGGGSTAVLKKYAQIWEIPTDHFDPYAASVGPRPTARPLAEVLVEGSSYSRRSLKQRLIRDGLKPRSCELCGQADEWRGKPMGLILDHINGVNNDNRLENLRILCPNCAATLETHCGRANRFVRERHCLRCGRSFEPRRSEQRYCSRACGQRSPGPAGPKPGIRKVDRPPYARLKREVAAMGWSAVGRRYGVSDNAVRKWIRWYEAELARAGNADAMKHYSCSLVANCDARFEAPDEEGVMRQVVVHAREAHGMDEVPPEVADKVLAGIEGVSEAGPPAPAA